jgi:hypothetical protein
MRKNFRMPNHLHLDNIKHKQMVTEKFVSPLVNDGQETDIRSMIKALFEYHVYLTISLLNTRFVLNFV